MKRWLGASTFSFTPAVKQALSDSSLLVSSSPSPECCEKAAQRIFSRATLVVNDARYVGGRLGVLMPTSSSATFVTYGSNFGEPLSLSIAAHNDQSRQLLYAFGVRILPLVWRYAHSVLHELSNRAAETLSLVCCGCTDTEAAKQMEISQATLRSHLRKICRQFGVSSRAELSAIAALRERFGVPVTRPGCDQLGTLAPREREVAALLQRGCSEKEIAIALGLSVHTVHTYTKAIYRRLSIHRSSDLRALPLL